MRWWHHIITGPDNATVSIGRVLGLIAFALFIVAIPIAAMITTFKGWVPSSEWVQLLGALGIYVPVVLFAIAAVIGGTAFTDPKQRPFLPQPDGGDHV